MLSYRFPGEEIVRVNGDFIEVDNFDIQGFVITDFNQKKKFVFKEAAPQKENQAALPFCIDEAAYFKQATQLIKDLNRGIADKIVFSRIKEVELGLTSPEQLFERMLKAYPQALVYYFHDTCLGSWLGASPEILLEKTPSAFRTMALAGTKLAGENRDFTHKEYNEHALVTEFIEGQLKQIPGAQLQVSALSEYSQGPVTHLLQELTWQMPQSTLPLLLKYLHPTPAVAGLPQKVAVQYINALETHDRALYTGIIGNLRAGHEKLFVNLRCAQVHEGKLYIYVGGGFTPDSVAEQEWQETENKSKTLLQLL
jgi:isochorismate synthase